MSFRIIVTAASIEAVFILGLVPGQDGVDVWSCSPGSHYFVMYAVPGN
jgi:hypothetical protein